MLGDGPDADRAIQLISGHLLASTYETYGRAWQRFVAYCDANGLPSLPATPASVVNYVSHLSQLGTLQPQSIRVHLSAINKAHTDLGFDDPATGGLVAAVRRGWALLVHGAGKQRDERVGLPASVAARALDMVLRGRCSDGLTRAFMYTAFGFALMARSDTDIHLQRQDVETTPASAFVRLRREKGRATDSIRRRLEIPRAAVPGLYDALVSWRATQASAYARAGHTLDDSVSFWRLPTDTGAWASSSATCDGWLQAACTALNAVPPAGEAWTSHSLRIGAASAANAIDVNLLKIKDWGGWRLASSAVMAYIRPTLACDAALRFFGWMRLQPGFPVRPHSRAG